MFLKNWTQVAVVALVTAVVSSASAQSVSFVNVADAVVGRNFNPAGNALDPANSNKLLIGIHSGYDPVTWTNRAFIASTTSFHMRSTSDSYTVKIDAPAGYSIASITYRQNISVYKSQVASYAAALSWSIDGVKRSLAAPLIAGGTLTSVASFAGNKSSALVKLDSALSATDIRYLSGTSGRFVKSGTASIQISSPSLEVVLVPAQ